jgi:hypothetical protein
LTDEPALQPIPPQPAEASWQEKIRHTLRHIEVIPGQTRFDMAVPQWKLTLAQQKGRLDSRNMGSCVPKFCPCCGVPLPEVVRRARSLGPTHRPVSDGDYCGTCQERSRECRCLPPATAWRPVTEKEEVEP